MNILFGLAIILVLMLSEASHVNGWIASDESRVALLLVFTSIPPLFAAAQVCFFHCRFTENSDLESKRAALSRYAIWHFTVWFLSSLSVVGLIGWQATVRASWRLDRFPAIDELLILAPSLVSLIVSWFILFETQSSGLRSTELVVARREYVSLRCKVYLLLALVPITAMILIKDFWIYIESLPLYVALFGLLALLLLMLAVMPWLVGKIWSSRSVSEAEGRDHMLRLCQTERMNIRDILIWDTSNSVVNALVAGIFPRFRVLMVSDLLISTFPKQEVCAILRHEAGHLRMAHLPIRLAFILLPAAAMIAIDLDPNQTMVVFGEACLDALHIPFPATYISAFLLGLYFFFITAWLSRMMEFEADLYSAGFLDGHSRDDTRTESCRSSAMCDALHRFADECPEQMSKSSLTHPSLQQRIEMIKECSKNPLLAARFRRRFVIQQAVIAGLMLILTGVVLSY